MTAHRVSGGKERGTIRVRFSGRQKLRHNLRGKQIGLDDGRPPKLTDKPYTGKYRVRKGHLPLFGFKISRADVADFKIKAVENPTTIRKVVGVCN